MAEIPADFDEVKQSQLPFVELLINLGYQYISSEDVLVQRGHEKSRFLLKNIAVDALTQINSYEHEGRSHSFSPKDVLDAVEELEATPLEGLIDTSKKIYHTIMTTTGGKTIKVFHGGKSVSKSFKYIDFANPEKNQFHVTVEYQASGRGEIRPDIVCFVNGIPFVVIENKKASVDVEMAIDQMVRNQQLEYCPKLFVFPQLLIATNSSELRYGTTLTPKKFYAIWKEKEISPAELDAYIEAHIQKPINSATHQQLCADLKIYEKASQSTDRLITAQDRGIVALLKPKRLLDIAKNNIIYDAGIKKIMRYQQFFAVHKMLTRIESLVESPTGQRRSGGLLWHTQGSGKSLTMVMFVKALIDYAGIQNPRVLIVTDRKDLDTQIETTFRNCGLKKGVIKASSGQHLLDLIKQKNLNVITTLVHKFDSASKNRADFCDTDKNIFVLVDEAHRTQSGLANLEMNRILPNACYIGFTGTPLLRSERESWRKFGGYIDKYTIDDAREDKIVLDLVYEGRYVDLVENKDQIDRRVERLLEDLDDEAKVELQKIVNTKIIKDNPQRIAEIANDIERHYISQFQGTGLKAQVVAPSKFSAVLMQKAFEFSTKVQTALVISGENGIVDEADEHKKEVIQYLEQSKAKYQSLESYEKEVIESFKHNDEGIEIIIVVDKLLTGFDAPRNTVLYLAKDLKDHNLLQSIARVNRLFENKVLPKTSGFIIDYSENAKNLDTAMKLFGNYEDDDVHGALIDVKEKIQELEQDYSELHETFKTIENKSDNEAYLSLLAGTSQEDGELKRKKYYSALNKFIKTFNECVSLQEFAHEFKQADAYKRDMKKFLEIRQAANMRYADKVDLSKYRYSLVKIMDQYVDSQGVELLTKQINITDAAQFEEALSVLGTDKSKAEAIAENIKKTIEEKIDTDRQYYQKISDKIRAILEKMREGKLADIEALRQMKMAKDEMLDKKDDSIPEEVTRRKGADIFYRNLESIFKQHAVSQDAYIQIICSLNDLVKSSVIIDWYKNPEVKRMMKNAIDDFFYDEVLTERKIPLNHEEIKTLVDDAMHYAENNHELFDV